MTENSKDKVLKFLKKKKAIPRGCENNEYWIYWRNMLLEYANTVLPKTKGGKSVCSWCGELKEIQEHDSCKSCIDAM